MPFDIGDAVPLTWSPGTSGTASVTVTAPDGSTSTPTVAGTGSGPFTATGPATLAGQHVVRWALAGTSPQAYTDAYSVTAAADALLVSLADAKAHLGKSVTASDEELRAMVRTASEAAEVITGRVWRQRTVVETHTGGTSVLSLRRTPVQSVTSVTVNGSATTSWALDADAGLLYAGSTAGAGRWGPGLLNVVVTYVAGPAVVPDMVLQGVKELIRHLWATQRGAAPLNARQQQATGGADDVDPRLGYALPRRVEQLWAPFEAPGF